MTRPHVVLAVCTVLALTCMTPAPAAARTYRVAMVLSAGMGDVERAFEESFADSGQALQATEVRFSGSQSDQPQLVARLRELAPDLIYTVDTATTLAVAGPVDGDPSRFIEDIPVIFTSVSDPVGAGLVPQLARPGRNVTGVIPLAPLSMQLDAAEDFHLAKSIGFLYGRESQALVLDQLRKLCNARGITLLDEQLPQTSQGQVDPQAIAAAVAHLKNQGAESLYIGPETFATAELQETVVQAALQAHLPTFTALETAIRNHGALFGVVSPPANIGRFAALKALRVLSSRKFARDEPIETLEHFSIVINMQTALRLQVYPPLPLLDAADIVTAVKTR